MALIGQRLSVTVYTALKIAYGLCGSYSKIALISSSSNDNRYQHILGNYSTLHIPADATPQRYMEIMNIVGPCGFDVIIFSGLSIEWREGVTRHLPSSYYEDVLKAHNTFMSVLRHFPRHVIGCIETKRNIIKMNTEGVPKIDLSRQIIQQPGIEKNFTTVLKMDKKGRAEVVKDLSQTLPQQQFYPDYQIGAVLQDWCCNGNSYVPEDLQQKIDDCNSIRELYQLLFEMDIEDVELISAFTRRRMVLEGKGNKPSLEVIQGGFNE